MLSFTFLYLIYYGPPPPPPLPSFITPSILLGRLIFILICFYLVHYIQFNLACQEWKRTLVGTIHNIGMLVSLPIMGYISDR